MSDYNSSLPVRTENNGDVAAKIVDGTITSQALAVDAAGKITTKLDDAAGNGLTSQTNGAQRALDVGINVAGVQIDPRTIRALTSSDTVTVVQPSGANLHVNVDNFPATVAVTQSTSPWVVSGTVTTTQGTSPWITKDQSDGPVAPGTVASFSQLTGGQFNTVLPTLTNGQQAALQVDSSGRLLVTATVTSTDDHNYGTVGANTPRTAAQIGNATGAADFNFGTVGAQTLRAASQIGNATGAADFNAGATGAQTLRTTSNQGAPNTIANAWPVKLTDGTNSQSFTASGESKVDITTSITLTTTSTNFPTTVDTNYGTVGANTVRSAAQIGNATGAADFNNGATGAQTLRVAANLAVAGADVSSTNPVPVTLSSAPLGTAVDDYKTVATLAANATNNHDYTVTAGKTLLLKQIEATGSGKAKIEVEIETGVATGVFTSKFVQFNSTATPNMSITLQDPISVAAGVRVRVAVTNRDNQSQDVYSTICGQEV